jgi:hypothetical protein
MTYTRTGCDRRNASGQALAEGCAALILVTMIIVGGVVLILGAGTAIYYKIKIAMVVDNAARFGTQGKFFLGAIRPDFSSAKLKADVVTVVQNSCAKMGLPVPDAEDVEVDSSATDSAGHQYVSVTLHESGLPLISGGILPKSMTVSDTAVATMESSLPPPAVLGLTLGASPDGTGYYIPIYGRGKNPVLGGPHILPLQTKSRKDFAYYAAGVQSVSSNHGAPATWNNGSGPLYDGPVVSGR